MALTAPSITSDQASQAMIDGLISRIRESLRARIMERIQPDIDDAIDESVKSLKVAIEAYRDPSMMTDTVRVLIERR